MTDCRVVVAWMMLLTSGLGARAEVSLTGSRSILENWVETRQLISKTRGDWESDKEFIGESIQLYQRELASVAEQMTRLGTNSSQVEQERLEAETLLKDSNESLEKARQFATGFEGRIRKLVPRLPPPLQDTLHPLLARLPADAAQSKMTAAEQVQVIVGMLNEVDKFNNAVSVFNEKRRNDRGEEVAVETVYVGLGAAYFVNEAGDFAGTGTPGKAGWDWTINSRLAPSVKEVIRIYRNESPARFVSLPAVIH